MTIQFTRGFFRTAILVILLIAGMPLSVWATSETQKTKEDTNREVALTYAQVYLEQRLYSEAETALQLSLKNDGEDGAVLNLLGLVQLQQKNYSQACHSFQTAGIVFKDIQNRAYALYNLADCLHRGGRRQESINILKDLIKKEEGVSNSAEKTLELMDAGVIVSGEPLPPYRKRSRGTFRLTGALNNGFDSNVLLVEEAVATGIAVKDRGSLFTTPAIQFGYLGKALGNTLLDARLVNAYTQYLNSYASSFNNLYNRMDLMLGSGNSRFGLFGDLVFLNLGTFGVYNYDAGLVWQNVRKISPNQTLVWEVPLRYQKFILNTSTLSVNDRTGGGVQVKASFRNQWSDNEYFSFTPAIDNQYTTGKNYRLSGIAIPFTIGIELPMIRDLGLINTFTAELNGQWFWQSELNRRDYSYRLGAGLTRTLFESWNFSLDFYILKNKSTVDAATYSKGVTSLLLTHHFL